LHPVGSTFYSCLKPLKMAKLLFRGGFKEKVILVFVPLRKPAGLF
jgi:hypothetical protein